MGDKTAPPVPPLCPQIEQRIEPAKRAAHSVSKRLQACLQGPCGSEMDKRVVRNIFPPHPSSAPCQPRGCQASALPALLKGGPKLRQAQLPLSAVASSTG